MNKKTLVLGASLNPERYSNMATKRLIQHGHSVVLIGLKVGEIMGETIHTNETEQKNVDTITLYLNPNNQKIWYNYILNTKPKRIIFNPGTENPELFERASSQGIECIEACTLVLLSVDSY